MGKAYKNVGTYTPENLIADCVHPLDTQAVTISTGSATFKRATLINSNGAKANGTISGGTAGVYTLTISTALGSGDTLEIKGGSTGSVEYDYSSSAITASAQATAIAALFTSDTVFTVAASSGTVTFTQKKKGYGDIPTITTTGLTTGAASIAKTTTGVKGTVTADTPVGILCEEVVQDSTNTTPSIVYISGDFYKDAIIVGDDVVIEDFETELRKLGIFLK